MKIANQTQGQMALKDNNIWKFVFGGGFILFGIGFGITMYASGTHGAALLIPLILLVIGILSLLFMASLVVEINKSSGQIVYTKKRLIGNKISTYPIADVLRVETRKHWEVQRNNQKSMGSGFQINNASSGRLVLFAQSLLVLKDGKTLPLDIAKGSPSRSTASSTVLAENEAAVAKKVADFLNLPFQVIEPPNVGIGPTFGSTSTV
jgi:hypothetical protein